ncbi:hypothetical protein TH53_23785 [Pedobacter lusitanus]|uniref:Multidrug resistance protein MdtA-like C-terminal permuted SH3 domain-containing protein n=1 Tax=Pedobacter lusitanus TaxID=1503925 RepID=A0A0D0FR48_9SPHI|nr:HlyD family efflux transporter periplasmic adaptor subunit [Pedobacter lusitanus]KIO74904.1 hypothetical protein TH53_23785 [Pedobacter lusitanus]
MDIEIPVSVKQVKKRKLYFKIFLIGIALVLFFLGFRFLIKSSISKNEIKTGIVEVGSMEATITAAGLVVPEYEQIITSPIEAKLEQILHNAGDKVKKGEPILKLDKEFIQIQLDKLYDAQKLNRNKIVQLRLSLNKTLTDMKTQYAVKKVNIENLESKLKGEKYLIEIGGGTKENLQQAKLNLEIAKLELKQIEDQVKNQQKSMAADLNGLGFEINIQEKSIQELEKRLEQAEVRASRDGVITWVADQIGSKIDAGSELVRIADLNTFKVEGSISDHFADQLKVGGEVIVRINNTDLRGEIGNVKPAVENGIIKFMVNLKAKSNNKLRSNLKTDLFVVTSFKDKILRVKNGPFYSGASNMKVFVIDNNKAVAKAVTIGESNQDYVEIKSGLKEGDKIIISDTKEYSKLNEAIIK